MQFNPKSGLYYSDGMPKNPHLSCFLPIQRRVTAVARGMSTKVVRGAHSPKHVGLYPIDNRWKPVKSKRTRVIIDFGITND